MTSAAVRGLTSIPIAPATLFVPQPISRMRDIDCLVLCSTIGFYLATFRLHAIDDFMNLFASIFALKLMLFVFMCSDKFLLLLHLFIIFKPVGIEFAAFECRFYRAVRLALVLTIIEITLRCQFLNVYKIIG